MKTNPEICFKRTCAVLLVVSLWLCFGCSERPASDRAKSMNDQTPTNLIIVATPVAKTTGITMATNPDQHSETNGSQGRLSQDEEVIQAVRLWCSAHHYSTPRTLSILQRNSNYWVVVDTNPASVIGMGFQVDPKTKRVLSGIGE